MTTHKQRGNNGEGWRRGSRGLTTTSATEKMIWNLEPELERHPAVRAQRSLRRNNCREKDLPNSLENSPETPPVIQLNQIFGSFVKLNCYPTAIPISKPCYTSILINGLEREIAVEWCFNDKLLDLVFILACFRVLCFAGWRSNSYEAPIPDTTRSCDTYRGQLANMITYSSILDAFCKNDHPKAIGLFKKTKDQGVQNRLCTHPRYLWMDCAKWKTSECKNDFSGSTD
ncbi:hypothetical protein JHK85_046302 [Glycine max]|nr:hypothetical protein JHK85_046302 [Glycine max]